MKIITNTLLLIAITTSFTGCVSLYANVSGINEWGRIPFESNATHGILVGHTRVIDSNHAHKKKVGFFDKWEFFAELKEQTDPKIITKFRNNREDGYFARIIQPGTHRFTRIHVMKNSSGNSYTSVTIPFTASTITVKPGQVVYIGDISVFLGNRGKTKIAGFWQFKTSIHLDMITNNKVAKIKKHWPGVSDSDFAVQLSDLKLKREPSEEKKLEDEQIKLAEIKGEKIENHEQVKKQVQHRTSAMEEYGIQKMGLASNVNNRWITTAVSNESNKFFLNDEKVTWFCTLKPSSLSGMTAGFRRPKYFATWYGPDGNIFKEEEFTFAFGNAHLYRNSIKINPKTPDFFIGDWRIEVHYKGQLLDERAFTISR